MISFIFSLFSRGKCVASLKWRCGKIINVLNLILDGCSFTMEGRCFDDSSNITTLRTYRFKCFYEKNSHFGNFYYWCDGCTLSILECYISCLELWILIPWKVTIIIKNSQNSKLPTHNLAPQNAIWAMMILEVQVGVAFGAY